MAATVEDAGSLEPRPAWGAVVAMALCSFVLVASEFMPVSLLTPIAGGLQLTEGQAGLAIAISGLFAMLSALAIGRMIGSADRRHVLLAMMAILVASGLLVGFATSAAMFIGGRALLGLAIGGFWSMSAAIAMRLVPSAAVPKALAVINGGTAFATVIGAPAGSLAGSLIGWRGAMLCVVPLSIAATVWLMLSLPRLPRGAASSGAGILSLLRRRSALIGFVACAMAFAGQFSLYTYIRPFLEQVTRVGVGTLTMLLLLIGTAGLAGTALAPRLIGRHLHVLLAAIPAVMAIVAVLLAVFGTSVVTVAVLLAVWGLASTAAPVVWWTWVTRATPEDPEAGGGFVVAIVQFSIIAGALIGGAIYDAFGPTIEFLSCAAILLVAVPLAYASKVGGS